MSGFSSYLEEALLNHILRADASSTSYSPPDIVYVGLHTADPTDEGLTADEVVGGSYARAAASFGAPVSSALTNTSSITFVLPAVTVTHVSIWDAATGGNMLFSSALTAGQLFNSGDSVAFLPGGLQISLE